VIEVLSFVATSRHEFGSRNLDGSKMNRNPKKPKSGRNQEADVDAAWQRLLDNRNDDIENTFCRQLFELNQFDEEGFAAMCSDMTFVLNEESAPKENYKLLIWIISCVIRSVFSHLNGTDLYKIRNFDEKLFEKWNVEYLEKLRSVLDEVFEVAVQR
jgi:hypothetical protein